MHAHPPPHPHDNHGGAPVPVHVLHHHPVAPPFLPPPQHHHHGHHRSFSVADSQSGSLGRSTSQWSTGLCHCFDDPANCLVTGLCPCITFGQIAEIVNRGQPTCVFNGAITYGLLLAFTGLACLYSCSYRSKLRTQYDLKESPFPDCLVHCFCETCALCQEYRELKMRGFDMSIGWDANVKRQAYGITTAPAVVGGMIR